MLPDFWGDAGGRGGRLRYGCCGLVVACVFGLLAARVESHETGSVASDSDAAVLLDLPPALASSAPRADQTDAPEMPPPVASTTPDARPEHDATHAASVERTDAILPPPEPPHPKADAPQAPPAPAPADPAQAARIPGGSEVPAPDARPVESEAARSASAKAISRWQQAMVAKLEATKHFTSARPRDRGIVEIAFAIDRRGHLVRRAVAKSSGVRTLDDLALKLVDAAAPFASPPAAMGEAALAFTIPIRFNLR